MKRVAIVTNASRGFGSSIARRLALDGFVAVVSHSGDLKAALVLAAEIRDLGGFAFTINADVAHKAGVESLFRRVRQMFGQIDVVVCNADLASLRAPESLANDDAEIAIATSLRATLLVLAQAAKDVAHGGRVIVALGGVFDAPAKEQGPAKEFAQRIEARAYALAKQLRARHITMNLIVQPAQGAGSVNRGDARSNNAAGNTSTSELGHEAPDVAGVVSLLAGPHGRLVNSRMLYAGDGLA